MKSCDGAPVVKSTSALWKIQTTRMRFSSVVSKLQLLYERSDAACSLCAYAVRVAFVFSFAENLCCFAGRVGHGLFKVIFLAKFRHIVVRPCSSDICPWLPPHAARDGGKEHMPGSELVLGGTRAEQHVQACDHRDHRRASFRFRCFHERNDWFAVHQQATCVSWHGAWKRMFERTTVQVHVAHL